MKPSFLFLCLGLCLLDCSTAEATCTATQLSECSNIIECKSGLTSCELPYALCLRRHKCPEDMYVDMLAANATYFVLSENVHLSSGYSLRSRMVTNGIKLESEVHLLADLGASAFVETHRGRPTGIALAEYVAEVRRTHHSLWPLPMLVLNQGAAVVLRAPRAHFTLRHAVRDIMNKNGSVPCAEFLEENLYAACSKESDGGSVCKYEQFKALRRRLVGASCGYASGNHFAQTGGVQYIENNVKNSISVGGFSLVASPSRSITALPFDNFVPVRVISLDRRQDRWENFIFRAQTQGFIPGIDFMRFSAVDGRNLQPDDLRLKAFFADLSNGENVLSQTRAGVVGCALSHVALWEELAKSALALGNCSAAALESRSGIEESMNRCSWDSEHQQKKLMLVFEDDAEILVSRHAILSMLNRLIRSGFDGILSLGYHARGRPDAAQEWDLRSDGTEDAGAEEDRENTTEILVAALEKRHFLGGTFGYVISAKQATKFLNMLASSTTQAVFDQARGTFAVDHFMRQHTSSSSFFATTPRIVHAAFAYRSQSRGVDVDSDIAPI